MNPLELCHHGIIQKICARCLDVLETISIPKVSSYVVGFMFSREMRNVALIRKTRPDWQAGKLNGIGGKVEDDESIEDAMMREFREEAGIATLRSQWRHFCTMSGNNDSGEGGFQVDYFATLDDPDRLKSMTDEKVEVIRTSDIHPLRSDVVENIPWLISLAIDHLDDGLPGFVNASYP